MGEKLINAFRTNLQQKFQFLLTFNIHNDIIIRLTHGIVSCKSDTFRNFILFVKFLKRAGVSHTKHVQTFSQLAKLFHVFLYRCFFLGNFCILRYDILA